VANFHELETFEYIACVEVSSFHMYLKGLAACASRRGNMRRFRSLVTIQPFAEPFTNLRTK
jgi:hypothetical protein